MNTRCLAPLPVSERDLPHTIAEPYFKVADEPFALVGPALDRNGHLLFVDIYGGRVLRLSPTLELATVFAEPGLNPAGIAVHRDGRIFVAACGARNPQGHFDAGTVFALSPDGKGRQVVLEPAAGYVPNDLVFDPSGGGSTCRTSAERRRARMAVCTTLHLTCAPSQRCCQACAWPMVWP